VTDALRVTAFDPKRGDRPALKSSRSRTLLWLMVRPPLSSAWAEPLQEGVQMDERSLMVSVFLDRAMQEQTDFSRKIRSSSSFLPQPGELGRLMVHRPTIFSIDQGA
jgi:hypothetical protein